MSEEFYAGDGTEIEDLQADCEYRIRPCTMQEPEESGRRPDEIYTHGQQNEEQVGEIEVKKQGSQHANGKRDNVKLHESTPPPAHTCAPPLRCAMWLQNSR